MGKITKDYGNIHKIVIILLIAITAITAFNSYNLSKLTDIAVSGVQTNVASTVGVQTTTQTQSVNLGTSGLTLPKGVPQDYGSELGVSFDSVSALTPQEADMTIRKLAVLDQTLELDEAQNKRYINALYTLNNGISCEYCCGARSIIFENGEPACGCAHSFAMRGLAKHLIINSDYTDEQIQEELAKWKALFFPTQIQQKASILEQQGVELTFTNLGSNKYRGIEQGASGGGMVGGC